MSLVLAVQNLGAVCAQGLLVAAVAAVLGRLLPLDRPGLKLAWWQTVLFAILVLPWLGPWARVPVGRVEVSLTAFGPALGSPTGAFGRWSWAEVVAAVLLAGFAGRVAWLAAGAWRLRACRHRATILDPRGTALAGLDEALGVRAAFRVADAVGAPATFGLRTPVVLLPPAFFEMDGDRQRAVATHELVHIRRRDWLATVAEEALLAVFWFHPAVHVLLGRIRLAREQCVDEEVVRLLGGRRVYLESLIEMARHLSRGRAVPAALLLRERHLRDRVELLLKEVTMSKVRALSHLAASAAFVLLAGALASFALPLEGTAKDEKPTSKTAAEARIVHKVNPVYPADAKKDHLEGLVHIDVRIAKDGSVAEAKAKDGHPTLAEAALAAVRQWRYEPVLGPDKKPVEARLTVTIRFTLA
jgi:bla regulator protein blaR1